MGRKRLDKEDKRVRLTVTLPFHLVEKLKNENVVISQLMEILLKEYLKR